MVIDAREKAEDIYRPQSRSKQVKNFRPRYFDNQNFMSGYPVRENQDIGLNLATENPIGAGIIQTIVDGSIGKGLDLESSVTADILEGVQHEAISDFQKKIEALWKLYSNNSRICDFYGMSPLGELERMAFTMALCSGDVLTHIGIADAGNGLYLPRIQLISGNLVQSPNLCDTGDITAGVERDGRGRDIAYYVAEVKPDQAMASSWRRCSRLSKRGRLAFSMMKVNEMTSGCVRGRSIFNSVQSTLIQADRYTEAETVKAIIHSYITLFIEKEKDVIENPDEGSGIKAITESQVVTDGNAPTAPDDPITMAPGAAYELAPGEKAHLSESQAPTAAFEQFMGSLFKIVGMAVGIPYEVLIKSFNASYSASQASIQDAARGWALWRAEFSAKFLQEIYSQFVYCMVAQGKVNAPGYLSNDPFVRAAWEGSVWHGPAVIHVNPIASVTASIRAIDAGLSTRTIEARKLFGNDFESVAKHLSEERNLMEGLGIAVEANPTGKTSPAPAPEPKAPETKKEDENEEKK